MNSDTRTIALTGASSGIGAAAARALVDAGHRVIVIGRDPGRTNRVADDLDMPRYVADLDRLDAVRELAASLRADEPGLDVLANNAGGIVPTRTTTADGFEATLQRNVIAPFVLANALADVLRDNGGRMVLTVSSAHLFGRIKLDDLQSTRGPWFDGWPAYGAAKLAGILLVRQWHKRQGTDGFAFHPGLVTTRFGSDSATMRAVSALSGGHYGMSPEAGAAGLIRLAGDADVALPTGTYFAGVLPGRSSRAAHDDRTGAALWDRLAAEVPGWQG